MCSLDYLWLVDERKGLKNIKTSGNIDEILTTNVDSDNDWKEVFLGISFENYNYC